MRQVAARRSGRDRYPGALVALQHEGTVRVGGRSAVTGCNGRGKFPAYSRSGFRAKRQSIAFA